MAKILWLILFAYVVALTVAMVEKYNEERSIKFTFILFLNLKIKF
jgi:hypothetical protein